MWRHFILCIRVALCYHSNETHAAIANPPNSAQLEGTHTIPPSYVVGRDRQTHTKCNYLSSSSSSMSSVIAHAVIIDGQSPDKPSSQTDSANNAINIAICWSPAVALYGSALWKNNNTYKNSSGDEIANVNFLRQHRTCRGQRLRPFNEFVISTKRLRQKRYTLPTCLEMDSPVQSASASHNKWTRPSVKETHQATWA